MKRLINILLIFACAMPLGGQNRTQNGALTGQKKYPLLNYFELACPAPAVVSEWKDVKGVRISWGSVDSSYAKTAVPVSKVVKALRLDAWRGETVMAQALVWSAKSAPDVTFSLDLPFSAETGYVRYNPDPDVIDTFPRSLDLQPMTCQPVWLAIEIPRDASPGTYRGRLMVRSGAEVAGVLSLAVRVDARALPDPSEWRDVPDIIPNLVRRPLLSSRRMEDGVYRGVEPGAFREHASADGTAILRRHEENIRSGIGSRP